MSHNRFSCGDEIAAAESDETRAEHVPRRGLLPLPLSNVPHGPPHSEDPYEDYSDHHGHEQADSPAQNVVGNVATGYSCADRCTENEERYVTNHNSSHQCPGVLLLGGRVYQALRHGASELLVMSGRGFEVQMYESAVVKRIRRDALVEERVVDSEPLRRIPYPPRVGGPDGIRAPGLLSAA